MHCIEFYKKTTKKKKQYWSYCFGTRGSLKNNKNENNNNSYDYFTMRLTFSLYSNSYRRADRRCTPQERQTACDWFVYARLRRNGKRRGPSDFAYAKE